MGSTRYIMSMGELTRKDNSLCFRKNGKNVYIPVENTKEIFCFNEVSINTKLLDFLSQNNIIVHFTLEDWIREVKDIFLPTNKRDYNYGIIYHNQIYPINAD